MVSVFNIISLVVNSSTNNNNNDNNNNINDNQGNKNGAQNSESNTNNAMMAVTQVMQVPPGAGRRKRSIKNQSEKKGLKSTLVYKNKTLTLLPSDTEPIISSVLNDHIDETFLDEVGIGIMMCLNNWQYIYINESYTFLPKACLHRNLCEMNHNCALFGNGAKLVSTIVSNVIARNLAETDEEEDMFLIAAYRDDMLLQPCDYWYRETCPKEEWTSHTNNIKHLSRLVFASNFSKIFNQ